MTDPDEYQKTLRAPIDGEDEPTGITVLQAQKVAAIVEAANDGHTGFAEYMPVVARYLHAAAIEAQSGEGVVRPTARESWAILDDVPWPPVGGPKPQSS